ncbi:hypothetical protein GO283_00585 [Ralstonia solanacearum]|nr:hypothetical protein [Ralstonia solanacearum]
MALRSRLDGIDARHERNIAGARVTLQAATHAVEAAKSNLLAVREEERQALAALYAAESIKGDEARELRRELIDRRDTRGDEFHAHLHDAWDKLRHPANGNLDKANALRSQLQAAMSDVQGLARIPLTRAEVSERLTALSHRLEPKLHPFVLPRPMLDERGAVVLNRERLPFVEVLRDNGLLERSDAPKPQVAIPACSTTPTLPKCPATSTTKVSPVTHKRSAALSRRLVNAWSG